VTIDDFLENKFIKANHFGTKELLSDTSVYLDMSLETLSKTFLIRF
jgi:hypothetical protein